MKDIKKRIEIGDSVKLWTDYWPPVYPLEVIHLPSATGDCWILKHLTYGTIYHVQTYGAIELLPKERNDR